MTMVADKFRCNMSQAEAEIVAMVRAGASDKTMAGLLGVTVPRLQSLRASAKKKQRLAKEFSNEQTKKI